MGLFPDTFSSCLIFNLLVVLYVYNNLALFGVHCRCSYLELPDSIEDYFAWAYAAGARIHSNSWGHSANSYDDYPRSIDECANFCRPSACEVVLLLPSVLTFTSSATCLHKHPICSSCSQPRTKVNKCTNAFKY